MNATTTVTSGTIDQGPAAGRGLHVGLWIAQVLLAAMFAFAGGSKLIQTAEYARHIGSEGLVRFIGLAELAGALGMLLPSLTRIRPGLTSLAGLGLATTMLLAAGFHLARGETSSLVVPLVLGALALFVAWGRHSKAPIPPRP